MMIRGVFLANAIQLAGLTPQKVQVVWLKQANGGTQLGRDNFPIYAQHLRDDMATIVRRVRETYPNVQIVYLTSRIYTGYSRITLIPEPVIYEGAFSVRWLIQDQIAGGGESGITYNNDPLLLCGLIYGLMEQLLAPMGSRGCAMISSAMVSTLVIPGARRLLS